MSEQSLRKTSFAIGIGHELTCDTLGRIVRQSIELFRRDPPARQGRELRELG